MHDIVTVVVSEKNQLVSNGQVQRRRTAEYDAKLADWIKFKGAKIELTNPANGEPEIQGDLNVQNQAQMQLQTNDALLFRIAATVADIRPNGTFVIEARRVIRDNDELWEQSLSGIIRREDVLPNNTVMSENVASGAFKKWATFATASALAPYWSIATHRFERSARSAVSMLNEDCSEVNGDAAQQDLELEGTDHATLACFCFQSRFCFPALGAHASEKHLSRPRAGRKLQGLA